MSLAEFSDIFKVGNLHGSVWGRRDRFTGTRLEEHRLLEEQNINIGILGLAHLVGGSGKGQCYISHLYGGRGQWGSSQSLQKARSYELEDCDGLEALDQRFEKQHPSNGSSGLRVSVARSPSRRAEGS